MTPAFSLDMPGLHDAAWLHAALNNDAVNAALIDLPHPFPMARVTEAWIVPDDRRLNMIIRDEAGRPLVYVWFSRHADDPAAEFSFFKNPAVREKGLAQQALTTLWPDITTALQSHKIHRLQAHTRPDNRASQDILQRLGFRHSETKTFRIGKTPDFRTLSHYLLDTIG